MVEVTLAVATVQVHAASAEETSEEVVALGEAETMVVVASAEEDNKIGKKEKRGCAISHILFFVIYKPNKCISSYPNVKVYIKEP